MTQLEEVDSGPKGMKKKTPTAAFFQQRMWVLGGVWIWGAQGMWDSRWACLHVKGRQTDPCASLESAYSHESVHTPCHAGPATTSEGWPPWMSRTPSSMVRLPRPGT